MIGGLVTWTLFTSLALPTFYSLVHSLQIRCCRQPVWSRRDISTGSAYREHHHDEW